MNERVAVPFDARPIVRARQYRWAPWAFGIIIALGAILLFTSLEDARERRQGAEGGGDAIAIAPARPLPDLAVPAPLERSPDWQTLPTARQPAVRVRPVVTTPRPSSQPRITVPESAPPLPPAMPSQPLVQEPYVPPAPVSRALERQSEPGAAGSGRSFAQMLSNPSYTVVEGTLIPAILETALDSTRPGPVRAIVSRDVRGFDGAHILIPRGSRLIGAYKADLAPGQKRAMVNWTRLIRPDGVTLDLRSPSSDALGRAGVAGRVNNHTFRRITDSLLQTMVGLGSGLTQRAVAQPVIIVPQGSEPTSVTLTPNGSQIQPTLTVKQGARVMVFVSQDLDFSEVDGEA